VREMEKNILKTHDVGGSGPGSSTTFFWSYF